MPIKKGTKKQKQNRRNRTRGGAPELAHGPDTKELLKRISEMGRHGELDVRGLNITSFPETPERRILILKSTNSSKDLPAVLPSTIHTLNLTGYEGRCPTLPPQLEQLWYCKCSAKVMPNLPAGLRMLNCIYTQIRELPTLPPLLDELNIAWCPKIKTLPKLPESLIELYAVESGLEVLPELPPKLKNLSIARTKIEIIPNMPDSIDNIYADDTPLKVKQGRKESLSDYKARWTNWYKTRVSGNKNNNSNSSNENSDNSSNESNSNNSNKSSSGNNAVANFKPLRKNK